MPRPRNTLLLPILLAACQPAPPEAPAPRVLEMTAPPEQVATAAEQFLDSLGWTTLQGSSPYVIRAQHDARGDANGRWMVCGNAVGSSGDTRRVTQELLSTVAVVVDVAPSDLGSRVQVTVSVPRAMSPVFPGLDRGIRYTTHACHSSGALEQLLAESLPGSHG
jgi:hypothetical protein